MTTDAEMRDWASDTWHSFAPFTAIPVSVIYCSINLAAATLVRGIWNLTGRLLGRKATAAAEDVTNRLPRPEDGNPYRPPDATWLQNVGEPSDAPWSRSRAS